MEGTEDIYINQGLSPKKRVKKKDPPAGADKFKEDNEPDYENISVITKNKNDPLKQQSVSIQWAPPASAPSNSSRHSSVQKSLLGIYLFLGLAFLLCIVSVSLLVVKNSEFSMHLRSMKIELWNVSSMLQKEQDNAQQLKTQITEIKNTTKVYNKVFQQILRDLSDSSSKLNYLKNQLQKLKEAQKSGPSSKHNSTG
ncbi:mast cell-expressed membrane protein 1 [Sarcophilus harrisii]|uniref:mast cell-expressed membrane protein 1 n=1 Tax=Sarcophilus harrisii TaxID=9305 RepID=UPI000C7B3B20|nr:mast cell-expressed membrane protein 1 [Sarcophilus harrisii]